MSPRGWARTAGLLYLVIIVAAGFAQGVVREQLVIRGDPAATAERILAMPALWRAALGADLLTFMADAAVAVILYVLLQPVNRTVALLALAFRLLAHPAIATVNLLAHAAALPLAATDPAAAMQALTLHETGYLIAGAFFGVHCALLGWLLVRSTRFPAPLGWLMGAAAVGYLAESTAGLLVPSAGGAAAVLVVVLAVPAELALCLWLLVKGVREEPAAG